MNASACSRNLRPPSMPSSHWCSQARLRPSLNASDRMPTSWRAARSSSRTTANRSCSSRTPVTEEARRQIRCALCDGLGPGSPTRPTPQNATGVGSRVIGGLHPEGYDISPPDATGKQDRLTRRAQRPPVPCSHVERRIAFEHHTAPPALARRHFVVVVLGLGKPFDGDDRHGVWRDVTGHASSSGQGSERASGLWRGVGPSCKRGVPNKSG